MTDPGTRWEYGINIDFVGKAVEAASGKRLDAYLRENMFAPLGMNDTGFKITDSQRQRLVGMHARGEDGSLAPIPFELEQNPEFHMGGGGLYGTAADYIKFTQMILNKGRGNGNQLLKPETVALMGQNHIGDLTIGKIPTMAPMYTNDVDLYPDIVKKWGLSFLINTAKTAEGRSAGSLAWAGPSPTPISGIDPARNVAGVILMLRCCRSSTARRWNPLPDLSAASMPARRRQRPAARRKAALWTVIRARRSTIRPPFRGRDGAAARFAPHMPTAT
jgi:CubicO group peptidase (beta-lactamase class C family)